MNEVMRDVNPGDPITAAEQNTLRHLLTKLLRSPYAEGMVGTDFGSFRALGRPPDQNKLVVKIGRLTVPPSAGSYSYDETFNATVQVWDNSTNQWTDDPGGRKVNVVPLRDGEGYIPLEANSKAIPVEWNSEVQAYTPCETPDVAVLAATTEEVDSFGMQPAKRLVFNSDTKEFVIVADCYIVRIGT